jgi:hypothetical protein
MKKGAVNCSPAKAKKLPGIGLAIAERFISRSPIISAVD